MTSQFLNSDLSYNRRMIMREAVRLARKEAAAWQRQFGEHMPWSKAMAYGLRRVWSEASQSRGAALLAREAEARRALPAREREIASLRLELSQVEFIDSERAVLAARARIENRLLQLAA